MFADGSAKLVTTWKLIVYIQILIPECRRKNSVITNPRIMKMKETLSLPSPYMLK
jgi:hypothetical protein